MNRALVWIRRDLRTSDHVALAAATEEAQEVAVTFIFDRVILDELPDPDDRRLSFLRRSLDEVDKSLGLHGSALLTRYGDPVEEIPRLAAELRVDAVFTNGDMDPYALRRDAEVARRLKADGRQLKTFKDHVIFAPNEILSGDRPYRVYTPYSRAWLKMFDPAVHAADHIPDLSRLIPRGELEPHLQEHPLEAIGFAPNDLWLEPGERAGRAMLEAFVSHRIREYKEDRNIPAISGTSGLSAHLRHGTLSIREAARAASAIPGEGAFTWLKELVWRDFYHAILGHFPHVVERPFNSDYDDLVYPGGDAEFDAWTEGRTGFPIVDAPMRHLAATGFMPNRLRMVTASFLTKDLLVDYRRGEAHFARLLLDFDLASNNGGWQWAASTGCDPQPYFRIFNPVLQSERFDPDGTYIREWIPELAKLDNRAIHAPWAAGLALEEAGIVLGRDYPMPIVDHAEQRPLAISLLREARAAHRPE